MDRKNERDECFNTRNGCIWGKEVYNFGELNLLAHKEQREEQYVRFAKNIVYMGNIFTYDTCKTYAFFRDVTKGQNYLMDIS